jgi:hypothetical protein
MTMPPTFNIDDLMADLRPVRRLDRTSGFATMALTAALICGVVVWQNGVRPDIAIASPHMLVVLRLGALAALAIVTGIAAIASGQPAVGRKPLAWQWALGIALLFPLAAIGSVLAGEPVSAADVSTIYGQSCLKISLIGALTMGVSLTLWLRKGATVQPELTGWLTGLASGSVGTFAYSLYCPMTNIYYIGLWYTLAVAVAAVAGRLLVPRLLRW